MSKRKAENMSDVSGAVTKFMELDPAVIAKAFTDGTQVESLLAHLQSSVKATRLQYALSGNNKVLEQIIDEVLEAFSKTPPTVAVSRQTLRKFLSGFYVTHTEQKSDRVEEPDEETGKTDIREETALIVKFTCFDDSYKWGFDFTKQLNGPKKGATALHGDMLPFGTVETEDEEGEKCEPTLKVDQLGLLSSASEWVECAGLTEENIVADDAARAAALCVCELAKRALDGCERKGTDFYPQLLAQAKSTLREWVPSPEDAINSGSESGSEEEGEEEDDE
eukprot:GDKI01030841.1.p1 GENE.GDKI01030841.1~~GDKI01030841.1.p1  ORF type:complete len:279 (+),score=88.11 GDKI01030841.1:55-891(+)